MVTATLNFAIATGRLEDKREEREEIDERDNKQQQLSWISRREGEVSSERSYGTDYSLSPAANSVLSYRSASSQLSSSKLTSHSNNTLFLQAPHPIRYKMTADPEDAVAALAAVLLFDTRRTRRFHSSRYHSLE